MASYNKQRFAPFILEQAEALKRSGCDVSYFGVEGKGVIGYLKSYPALHRRIKELAPDIIHAHYGLCGLLANLQRKVPVVTTYHGSDINQKKVRPFSRLSMALSSHNIFVAQKTMDIVKPKSKYSLIPCGVDLTDLQLTDKVIARKEMGLDPDKKYVLFSSAFDNAVKNYPLAREAMDKLDGVELLELKGYDRKQVTLLMCAVDALLMTSFSEGSPQVVKEAMACGCPIVSVDVGDVYNNIKDLEGCYVVSRSPEDIAYHIERCLNFDSRTKGRERIMSLGLSNDEIAGKLMRIYKSIVKK